LQILTHLFINKSTSIKTFKVFKERLITVTNGQIYDRYVNGVWQNPYQTETVFAMSPPLHAYSGKSFQIVLPSSLWFTNNSNNVSSIAVSFNDGHTNEI
jgi:hypothetical protein